MLFWCRRVRMVLCHVVLTQQKYALKSCCCMTVIFRSLNTPTYTLWVV